MNLRTQFFKARRLAMALAITGGLFLTAAAQGQAVLTDLGSNAVTGYVLPATVTAADISHLTEDLWIPIGSSDSYNIPTTGFGYSWNNNNLSPGGTFTTGGNAGGYELSSVSLQTGSPTNNDSGTDVNEPFTLTLYQIVPAGATTNCVVVTCYTANATLTNAGDWFSWTGLAVDLQPNTTYAYGFCEASSSTAGNNWDVYMVDTNNPNVFNGNEAIAQFPDAGGVVNFGVNSSTNATIYYTPTFDIGLTATPTGAAVPNTPAVSSTNVALPIPYGIVQGSTTVPLGTITLVAAVGGAQPFTYQWLSATGTNKLTKINGATGSTLDVNTYLIPTGNSNAYAYIAYNAVSTAGVTSAVEELVAAYPSMVDLGTLAAWQGGGAAPPSPGANDITQMSTASNQYANTSITMRDDGGFQNGLWPAQTFTTKAASQVISNIVTNIVVGVSTNYVTNFASASGWQATTLSVKTAGGGNFVLDGGWGTGFAIAGNLYDVAFYSLSGTGNTNATLIAGPYKYYGKGTENNWMQFQALQVDLAPNATYAWVWDLDSGNQNLSAGQTTDIYEDIWVTGGSPTLNGGGASGAGQIAVIQSPNAQSGVSGQVIPNQGAVQYNTPANTYDVTFDLDFRPCRSRWFSSRPTPRM